MTHWVEARGQVVIPKAIRARIGIEPGDHVIFDSDDEEVRIRRATGRKPRSRTGSKLSAAAGPRRTQGPRHSSPGVGDIRIRSQGEVAASADVARVRDLLEVIDPDWQLVSIAAATKADGRLSYADAFCLATARRADAPLWTGDRTSSKKRRGSRAR
jgi:AbrB family looped-hinge helix DNA binding protein